MLIHPENKTQQEKGAQVKWEYVGPLIVASYTKLELKEAFKGLQGQTTFVDAGPLPPGFESHEGCIGPGCHSE
jgi:hypothetical protein